MWRQSSASSLRVVVLETPNAVVLVKEDNPSKFKSIFSTNPCMSRKRDFAALKVCKKQNKKEPTLSSCQRESGCDYWDRLQGELTAAGWVTATLFIHSPGRWHHCQPRGELPLRLPLAVRGCSACQWVSERIRPFTVWPATCVLVVVLRRKNTWMSRRIRSSSDAAPAGGSSTPPPPPHPTPSSLCYTHHSALCASKTQQKGECEAKKRWGVGQICRWGVRKLLHNSRVWLQAVCLWAAGRTIKKWVWSGSQNLPKAAF